MAFRYFYGSAFVLTSDADVSFHHLSDFGVGALLPWPSHVHAVISQASRARARFCVYSARASLIKREARPKSLAGGGHEGMQWREREMTAWTWEGQGSNAPTPKSDS